MLDGGDVDMILSVASEMGRYVEVDEIPRAYTTDWSVYH